jgi:tryptophanyl-tRNA synthetase
MSKKIITGVKPTGSSMHLGNLMGAVLPFGNVAKGNDAAIFIADLHALTSVKDGAKLRDQSHELAIEYMSIYGLDTPITIFRQSDIRDVTKLMWILTNVTPYSLMLRAHSFKDAENKLEEWRNEKISLTERKVEEAFKLLNFDDYLSVILKNNDSKSSDLREHPWVKALKWKVLEYINDYFKSNPISEPPTLNMWVFNYPILMAADIIGYDIDAVPVGKDQIQHLEMTRDIARAFNKTYGVEVFREPEAIIEESVATLPGIDGRKMSKSYDNFIGIFDDDKLLKKRVMSIVSGSEWVDEKKKNPDECAIFGLYKVFATPEEIEIMRQKYNSENIGFGYGHAKTMLLEVLTRFLTPYRARREALLRDIPFVEAKLAEWAKVMNARLDAKMREVCEVVGVN